MNKRIKIMLLTFICLSAGVTKMALSDVGKVCLFSAISGVITLNGKPVAHAKLIRTVKKEKTLIDETSTNANGYFTMPAVYERTVTKFLPMEFVVNQDIKVLYKDKEYELWSGIKRNEHENSESGGEPLEVKCELNSKSRLKQVGGNPIFSLCVWDAEPDKINTGF